MSEAFAVDVAKVSSVKIVNVINPFIKPPPFELLLAYKYSEIMNFFLLLPILNIVRMAKVAVIDDERGIRNSLEEILSAEGYEVSSAADGLEGVALVKSQKPDVVFCDIKMPNSDGVEVLERIRAFAPDLPVIMISGHATIDTAVESIKKGAFDFIEKPLDLNRILITIKNALDKNRLVEETKSLKRSIAKSYEMIGDSAAMKEVWGLIKKVAPLDAKVLITGPNGCGKELVARNIHALSARKDGPFVEVNCAAIPHDLIESELFGHEKGAFTSAVKQRRGKFELASGGTLFLDEIGDMSLDAQSKVLRALQENSICRIGGDSEISVNVRVIAATNKDLKVEIEEGRFREDLYHRIGVIVIKVPPLSEHSEDIEPLVNYFVGEICDEMGIGKKSFSKDAIKVLKGCEWSGNIRELRNVVERLLILCGGKEISAKDVKEYM